MRAETQSAPASVLALLERTQTLVHPTLLALTDAPAGAAPATARLYEAMRYALCGPGKRLRPALVFLACEAAGGRAENAVFLAAAVECLHAYTLVHDDLPAMDDDNERRGRPTLHRAFDEATAILAGDALLTLAFGALAQNQSGGLDAVSVLAERSGARELLAGQARDVASQAPADIAELEALHAQKTGALFSAAAELGAIAAAAPPRMRATLAQYGRLAGIAFQFADDRRDGDHPGLAENSEKRRQECIAEAQACARSLPSGAPLLCGFADWIGGNST